MLCVSERVAVVFRDMGPHTHTRAREHDGSHTLSPTAVGAPPTAVGAPPTAVGAPPTAVTRWRALCGALRGPDAGGLLPFFPPPPPLLRGPHDSRALAPGAAPGARAVGRRRRACVGSTPPPSVHSPWATPRLWLWPRPCPRACPWARSCGPDSAQQCPNARCPRSRCRGGAVGVGADQPDPFPPTDSPRLLRALRQRRPQTHRHRTKSGVHCASQGDHPNQGTLRRSSWTCGLHTATPPPPPLARSHTDLGRPSAVTLSAKSLCGGVPSNAWHCGPIWDPLLVVGTGRTVAGEGGEEGFPVILVVFFVCQPSEREREGGRGGGGGRGSGSGSGRPARGSSTAGGGPRKRGAPNRHMAAHSVPPGKVEAGGPWRHPEPPGADTCRVSGGGGGVRIRCGLGREGCRGLACVGASVCSRSRPGRRR